MALEWPLVFLRGVERDLRHPARPHPGPGQAGGDAGAARAAAPARRAAADGAGVGDSPAARTGRLRGAGRRCWTCAHEAVVEHSDGRTRAFRAAPDRPVGEVTRDVLARGARLGGRSRSTRRRRRCPGPSPLDEDEEHARYDPGQVAAYFAAATQAALVLAAFRAPYRAGRRRSTHGGARSTWRSACSPGVPADPPSDDFIMRNAMDCPGGRRRLVARRRSVRQGRVLRLRASRRRTASPAPRCPRRRRAGTATLGEYILDLGTCVSSPEPHAAALDIRRSVFQHACIVCEWDQGLAASANGIPPPVA